ncbi:MAG: c-type cytochrome [Roseiflexaceae bacterium]
MLKISAVLSVLGLGLLLLSVLPLPGLVPEIAGAPATSTASTVASPTSAVASQSDAEYGRALFSAKGCVTCHHHAAVAGSDPYTMGNPDLTHYRPDPEFLRRWLKDPRAIRPATEMPTLGLHQDEIEALIAFLSASQTGG